MAMEESLSAPGALVYGKGFQQHADTKFHCK